MKVRRKRIRKKTGKSGKQVQEKNENQKEDKIKKNEDQERKMKIRKNMEMKTRRLWLKSNQYSNHYYNNHSVKVQTNNQFEVIKVENRNMIKFHKNI